MLIRVEIGIDAPGIDALLRRTFGRDAEAQAKEAGFDGFLRKPVTGAMLAQALASLPTS